MEWSLAGTIAGRVEQWSLTTGSHRVGRSPENAVVIPDPSVSRDHAILRVSEDRIEIEDLGSRNGTFVNGARIGSPRPLQGGDRIRLGSVELTLGGGRPAATEGTMMGTLFAGAPALRTSARMSWDVIAGSSGPSTGGERLLLRAVTEAGQLLVHPRPLQEVFDAVLDLVERTITARRILLLLKEGDETEPVVRAARPEGGPSRERIMLSQTIVEAVLTGRESLLVTDALDDPRFRAHESIVLQNIRSAMVAPLFDNERVLGLIYADTDDPLVRYGSDQLRAFTMLANLIAVKITNTRLLEDQRVKERMEQEIATAAAIQRNLLPAGLPTIPGFDILARQTPCFEVAGDLYDASILPDGRLCVVVGDVSGKGVGAALLMSHAMASLRLLYEEGDAPERLVDRIHRQVLRSSDARNYLTLFLGLIDPASGRIDYVNAGHNSPLLVARDGTIRALEATSMPVGLMEGTSFSAATTSIPAGGVLAIFSDGIPEARTDDEEYGDARLEEALRSGRGMPLEELADWILGDVGRFLRGAEASDDITLFLVRRGS